MPIEPVPLHTSDGLELEAELSAPDGAWAAAVLAHPHPLFGGNMRSIVTGALFDALPAGGVACLRFNFRGVGRSGGGHDEGRGERHDVEAAVAALAEVAEGLPLVLSGWSFGADTSLAVTDGRVAGWAAVAPPLRVVDPADMGAATDPRPKLLVLAEHDQFRDPATVPAVVASWKATDVQVVPGADHYFVGRTDRVTALVLAFARRLAA